ncbi:MAG: hypothetical protein JRN62_03170 [Nitrososphaerota archaeon]|jgi:hypothetical protein|nr:hypothetical protein [Nitrososphaerota archaeon]MDG6948598.1 hypothetical protein [Nitrososphaerota archaeon]
MMTKETRTQYRESAYEAFLNDMKSPDQRRRAAALRIQATVYKVTTDTEMMKNVIAALATIDTAGPIRNLGEVEKAFGEWNAKDAYTMFAPYFAKYLARKMMATAASLTVYGN